MLYRQKSPTIEVMQIIDSWEFPLEDYLQFCNGLLVEVTEPSRTNAPFYKLDGVNKTYGLYTVHGFQIVRNGNMIVKYSDTLFDLMSEESFNELFETSGEGLGLSEAESSALTWAVNSYNRITPNNLEYLSIVANNMFFIDEFVSVEPDAAGFPENYVVYNTTSKNLLSRTSEATWSIIPGNPIAGMLYVNRATAYLYTYNGTELKLLGT